MRLAAASVALLLAGCTSVTWVRTDGSPTAANVLQSDFAQCKAEAAQAGARNAVPQTTVNVGTSSGAGGFFGGVADGMAASRSSGSSMNYEVESATLEGCMARRGYLKQRR